DWGFLFHATELEGFDHFSAEKDQERNHRDNSKDRTGHQTCPIRNASLLLRSKRIDCDRNHTNGFFPPDKEGPEKFVPCRHSRQDGQGGQRGAVNRQDHPKENGKVRCAVDARCLLDILRGRKKHLSEEKYSERRHQRVRRSHSLKGVQPAEIVDKNEIRNEQNSRRDHCRRNKEKEKRVASWKPQPSECVGGCCAEKNLRGHGHGSEDHAVQYCSEKSDLC